MMVMDRLLQAIVQKGNPTALGLDTQISHLHKGYTKLDTIAEQCAAILAYNEEMLDLLSDIVPCVKVQVAYYEMLGLHGMVAFHHTLRMAKDRGLLVIADVKRNDIGATSQAYANAYLTPGADFEADFITVNGYLGIDGVQPFLDACKQHDKGIFLLVKTSNPSSGQVQDLVCGKDTIYETMADLTSGWGKDQIGSQGYSSIGAVVGATYPAQSVALRARMPHSFFLVPGYGAQGATGKDLAGCFDKSGQGAIVNASRSLLAAHLKSPEIPWYEAVRSEAIRMRDELQGAIQSTQP